jgi:hypothetical protein
MVDDDSLKDFLVGAAGAIGGLGAAAAGAPIASPGEGDTPTPPPVPDGWTPPEVETARAKAVEELFDDYPRSGVSGIYDPGANTAYIDPRQLFHHNDQLGLLDQMGKLPSSFIAFVWDTYPTGGKTTAEFEMPRSAGGAFQFSSRYDGGELRYIRSPEEVSIGDIYSAVYAVRTVGAWPDSPAKVEYLPEDANEERDATLLLEFEVEREEYRLGDMYQELSFAGSLPNVVSERNING